MYLCASLPLWFSAATESLVSSPPSLLSLLTSAHRMCLTRMVRRACSFLWFPGHVLLMCVAVDTLFQACLYEAAVLPALPENNSSSIAGNLSSEHVSSSPSSLSPSKQFAVSPHSALSSSSSSLSLYDSETNSSYESSNETDTFPLDPQHTSSTNDSHNSDAAQSNRSSSSSTKKKKSSSSSGGTNPHGNSQNQAVSSYHTGKPSREFPFALVVASSTAAVSILLFFCLSYIWHTRQLDRRAQKLAIRLAAESEAEVNCSQCRTPTTYMAGSSQDSGTDSGGEEEEVLPLPSPAPQPSPAPRPLLEELNSLNEEDEEDAEAEAEAEAEDGSRRKPGGVGRTLGSRRGRRTRRSGSRSSRKWSGHSGGQGRSSMVTDQAILNHFASRRHSTFFI